MVNYNELKDLIEFLNTNIAQYDEKGTKAASARIRTTLGSIKRINADVRRELVTADKSA